MIAVLVNTWVRGLSLLYRRCRFQTPGLDVAKTLLPPPLRQHCSFAGDALTGSPIRESEN